MFHVKHFLFTGRLMIYHINYGLFKCIIYKFLHTIKKQISEEKAWIKLNFALCGTERNNYKNEPEKISEKYIFI